MSDGQLSFVFFSYGDIQRGFNAFVGFNQGGGRSFSVPGSQTPIVDDIETCSNVGIPGLFVYRVDQYDIIQPNYANYSAGRLKLTCKYELWPHYATIMLLLFF